MKKFVSESWLILLLGVVFALLLAGTQSLLSQQIAANDQAAVNQAVGNAVPGTVTSEPMTIEGYAAFKCLGAQGELVGWAVKASGPGFVDKIVLVLGLSPDGRRVTGIDVTANLETPGLGNKIDGPWAAQYQQRDATRPVLVVKGGAKADKNEIDAITGATWSSRYVTDIVNEAAAKVGPKLAALAGGTAQ